MRHATGKIWTYLFLLLASASSWTSAFPLITEINSITMAYKESLIIAVVQGFGDIIAPRVIALAISAKLGSKIRQ